MQTRNFGLCHYECTVCVNTVRQALQGPGEKVWSLIPSGNPRQKCARSVLTKNCFTVINSGKISIGETCNNLFTDSSHSPTVSIRNKDALRGKRQSSCRNVFHSPLSCWNIKPLLTFVIKSILPPDSTKDAVAVSWTFIYQLLEAFLKARILHLYTNISDHYKENNSFRMWFTFQENNKQWTVIITIF